PAPESRRLDDQNIAAERIERALGGVTKEGMAQPRARHRSHGDDIGVALIRKAGKQLGCTPVLNLHLGSRNVVPLGELQYLCLHLRQIGAMDLLVTVFREVAQLRIQMNGFLPGDACVKYLETSRKGGGQESGRVEYLLVEPGRLVVRVRRMHGGDDERLRIGTRALDEEERARAGLDQLPV